MLAKIESADSISHLEEILDAVDGAMVARGDLGAELPVEQVLLMPQSTSLRPACGSSEAAVLLCIQAKPLLLASDCKDVGARCSQSMTAVWLHHDLGP